jgi:hypothetical protein
VKNLENAMEFLCRRKKRHLCEISLKCKSELRALTPAPAFSENLKIKESPKKNGFFVLGLPDLEHLLLQVAKKATG